MPSLIIRSWTLTLFWDLQQDRHLPKTSKKKLNQMFQLEIRNVIPWNLRKVVPQQELQAGDLKSLGH